MSRGFCQEKIFSNQDLVKPSIEWNERIIVNQIITSIIVKTIGKIASAYARIFHYEYNVMSSRLCQEKIF